MSDNPSLSVVLCSNSLDEFFFASIESVLSQTFLDFELIIVLNGSDLPVNAKDIIESKIIDHRIIIIKSEIEGLTFSLNLGLQHATSPIVARMDADDIAYPHRFFVQLEFLREHQDVMVCGSNYDLIDCNSHVVGRSNLELDDVDIRRKMYLTNPICHPTVMFRRSVALSVGGYSGDKAEDYDLWLRMMQFSTMKFINLPESLLGYRITNIGQARRAKLAYITMASSQLRMLFLTLNLKWLFAFFISISKIFFKSQRL